MTSVLKKKYNNAFTSESHYNVSTRDGYNDDDTNNNDYNNIYYNINS